MRKDVQKIKTHEKSFGRIIHREDLYLHTGDLICMHPFLHLIDTGIFKYNIVVKNDIKSCFPVTRPLWHETITQHK